jgi:GNAT superfamily N-acetyltransferase
LIGNSQKAIGNFFRSLFGILSLMRYFRQMEFLLRKAEIRDVAGILKLIKELAVYERASDEVEVTEADLQNDLFGYKPIIECIVAESSSVIVGISVYYEKYSTWKGRCLYLEDIIVTSQYRGYGIGKALFNAVSKVAKTQNYGRMEWQVLEWNSQAIEFYKNFDAFIDPEWYNCKFTREQLQLMDL